MADQANGRLGGRMELSRDGDVWTLTLLSSPTGKGAFENRFNPTFVSDFNLALDTVEGAGGALVTTSRGKLFCNGLDLNWMMSQPQGGSEVKSFMVAFHALLARVMTFPGPTVAAVQGHAFAGGCMLALAHDYRVMRSDRGFMCMNEIELGMSLTPGMNAFIKCRVPPPLWRALTLQGHRFSGTEAKALGMVDDAVEQTHVLSGAQAIASQWADKAGDTYGALKRDLYAEAAAVLEDPSPPPAAPKRVAAAKL